MDLVARVRSAGAYKFRFTLSKLASTRIWVDNLTSPVDITLTGRVVLRNRCVPGHLIRVNIFVILFEIKLYK